MRRIVSKPYAVRAHFNRKTGRARQRLDSKRNAAKPSRIPSLPFRSPIVPHVLGCDFRFHVSARDVPVYPGAFTQLANPRRLRIADLTVLEAEQPRERERWKLLPFARRISWERSSPSCSS